MQSEQDVRHSSSSAVYHVLDCSQTVLEFMSRMKRFKGMDTRDVEKGIQEEKSKLEIIASLARRRGDPTMSFPADAAKVASLYTFRQSLVKCHHEIISLYWIISDEDDPSWLQRAGAKKPSGDREQLGRALKSFHHAFWNFNLRLQQAQVAPQTDDTTHQAALPSGSLPTDASYDDVYNGEQRYELATTRSENDDQTASETLITPVLHPPTAVNQPTVKQVVTQCRRAFELMLTITQQEPVTKAMSNLCVWSSQIMDEPCSLDSIIRTGGSELGQLRSSLIRIFAGIIAVQEAFLKRNVEKAFDKRCHDQRISLTALLGYRELLPTALALTQVLHDTFLDVGEDRVHLLTDFELDLLSRHVVCAFEMLPTIRAERRTYAVSKAANGRPDKTIELQNSMKANLKAIEDAVVQHDRQMLEQGRPEQLMLPKFEPEKDRLESLLKASSSTPWTETSEVSMFAGKTSQVASVLSSFVSNHLANQSRSLDDHFEPSWPGPSRPKQYSEKKRPSNFDSIINKFLNEMAEEITGLIDTAVKAELQTEIVELE